MEEDHEILIFTATLEPASASDLPLHSLFVCKAQEPSVLMNLYSQCVTNQIKLGHRMQPKSNNKVIYNTLINPIMIMQTNK